MLNEDGHESVYCPVCWKAIWSHSLEPFRARASVPSRSDPSGVMMAMVQAALEDQRETRRRAEEAVREHFAEAHPVRLWLARRLGRNGLLRRRWPWSKESVFEQLRVGIQSKEE